VAEPMPIVATDAATSEPVQAELLPADKG
jgi:hypothetical protein